MLLPAGIFCTTSAIRKSPSYLPLAITPLGFGLQQLCEGVIWIGIGGGNAELVRAASLAYLHFALFFWPFWIPLSTLFLEARWKKRLVVGSFALLGLAGGLMLYLPLVINPDLVETKVVEHSLQYDFDKSPALMFPWTLWKVLYLAVVAVPILMSDQKEVVVVGFVLILLAGVSHYFNAYAFVSVWCFFAAVLSIYLCYFFIRLPWPGAVITSYASLPSPPVIRGRGVGGEGV